MRKIEKTVYNYNELSEKAKEKAREQVLENYPSDDWYEDVYESWIDDKLPAKGYNDCEINHTGFWSQGDGASFTCKSIDVKKWLELHKEDNKNYLRILKLLEKECIEVDHAYVKRDRWHNYVHENTTTAYVELNFINERTFSEHTNIEAVFFMIEAKINEELIPINNEIYSELRAAYNNLTTDEAIEEEIESEQHEFYEDGTKY